MEKLIAYIEDGNEQAVNNAIISRSAGEDLDASRWAGKSHAYVDVLAFIENELAAN